MWRRMPLSTSLDLGLIAHCESLWLDGCPSLLEPRDHTSQCDGWWSEAAPAAIAIWSEMQGTNLLQTLVQNFEISMQVLLCKAAISHVHVSAWDCTARGSKYKARVMQWRRQQGQTEKAFSNPSSARGFQCQTVSSFSSLHPLPSCSLR